MLIFLGIVLMKVLQATHVIKEQMEQMEDDEDDEVLG